MIVILYLLPMSFIYFFPLISVMTALLSSLLLPFYPVILNELVSFINIITSLLILFFQILCVSTLNNTGSHTDPWGHCFLTVKTLVYCLQLPISKKHSPFSPKTRCFHCSKPRYKWLASFSCPTFTKCSFYSLKICQSNYLSDRLPDILMIFYTFGNCSWSLSVV